MKQLYRKNDRKKFVKSFGNVYINVASKFHQKNTLGLAPRLSASWHLPGRHSAQLTWLRQPAKMTFSIMTLSLNIKYHNAESRSFIVTLSVVLLNVI
jgi:hypothetical protein